MPTIALLISLAAVVVKKTPFVLDSRPKVLVHLVNPHMEITVFHREKDVPKTIQSDPIMYL